MSFFHELQRRNVLRVGAGYAAGSWLIIEVAGTLGSRLLAERPPDGPDTEDLSAYDLYLQGLAGHESRKPEGLELATLDYAWTYLIDSPWLEPLRSDPEVAARLAEIERRREEQRDTVIELLDQPEWQP